MVPVVPVGAAATTVGVAVEALGGAAGGADGTGAGGGTTDAVATVVALGRDDGSCGGGTYALGARHTRSSTTVTTGIIPRRSEEHTSELQSPCNLVCRLLL